MQYCTVPGGCAGVVVQLTVAPVVVIAVMGWCTIVGPGGTTSVGWVKA